MAVFKCKMCGGPLEVAEGMTVIECEYCGTKQTLPKLDDEKRSNMYDRANHFRRNNEFDKAMGIYENILNEDAKDAEAYWSLVLCRYGVEYVEDPASHKRLPTINRAQFTSIFDDDNYKSALRYADAAQRAIFEAEATTINAIQKDILAISQKEEPFDVFVCYKESDNNGRRTPDSVLAQELYYQLKQEGFKVFFSRITLEDKLGSAYEPYIFAALNSAKVMVVLGTRAEFFNAVWVKNEWSRYLALIKQGHKKVLIPAYKDMDPYDLPEEFSHLQAQDMSKLGFMQDLTRGIKKIVKVDEPKTTVVKETVVVNENAEGNVVNIAPLLRRVFMFLEDGDWNAANEYCEKVLDQNPENVEAYLGKLMAEFRVKTREELKDCAEPFDHSNSYQKILRFGDENLKTALKADVDYIYARNENARLEGIYNRARATMSAATAPNAYNEAADLFETIREHRDSAELAKLCREKAETVLLDGVYNAAKNMMSLAKTEAAYKDAACRFEVLRSYLDSAELAKLCREKAELIRLDSIYTAAKRIMAKANTERAYKEAASLFEKSREYLDSAKLAEECLENAELARIRAKKAKKRRRILVSILLGLVLVAVTTSVVFSLVNKNKKYNQMLSYMAENELVDAYVLCAELKNYKNCASLRDGLAVEVLEMAEEKYLAGYADDAAELLADVGIKDPGYGYVASGNYRAAIASGITHIVIPKGVTSIEDKAFRGCTTLESVEIPNSVKSIGNYAFSNCLKLQSIVISDGVKSIGDYAFYACSGITSITMSNNVTSIGDYAFYDNSKLTSITLPKSLQSLGECAFYQCTSLTNVTMSKGVTTIGDWAFASCSSLTSVTIPESVVRIGNEAFRDCSSLGRITIPESVTNIGIGAFAGCSTLLSVTFKDLSTWYYTSNSSLTGGVKVDVASASRNATLLGWSYNQCYWYKE